MNTNFDKAIERIKEMSFDGGLTGSYDSGVISINFKVDEGMVLDVNDDIYKLSFITEIHASPGEVRFKKTDIKEVKHYAVGEFEPCTCCEVVQFFFKDGSELDFFEDMR